MFVTRVYTGAATAAVGSALSRATVKENAAKGRTVWEWLANVFEGVEHDTCSCSARKAQAELECYASGGRLSYWSCEVDKNGVCLWNAVCTTSTRGPRDNS